MIRCIIQYRHPKRILYRRFAPSGTETAFFHPIVSLGSVTKETHPLAVILESNILLWKLRGLTIVSNMLSASAALHS